MAAPEEFTVEQIVNQEDWTNDEGGQMTTFELLFTEDTRTWKAYRNHAKGHPEPVPGQQLSGWKNPDKGTFGIAAPLRGNAPRGGGKSFDRQPDHPLVVAQRLHTSCLSSVPAFIEQMLTIKVIEQPKDIAAYWALVTATARKLRETYPDKVLARAAEQNGQQTLPEADGEPPPTEGATAADSSEASASDARIPF